MKIESSKCVFAVCLTTSIALAVGGFLVPPTGVIDGSVITTIGLLLAFATVAQLPKLIRGHKVNLQHGKTTLQIEEDN